jgi:ribosomal protein L11 methyltransferase
VIRLAIRVRHEHSEVVLAELLEMAPAGVEEATLEDGRVEYAVYGPPGELPALPDLQALAGDAPVEISTTEIADDWSERWRDFHRPVLITPPTPTVPTIRVRPPWEPVEHADDTHAIELVIDPGQAFGTGSHATTRLCLELLLQLAGSSPWRGEVLDLGTGSGVLAIAAAKLGFQPVIAIDHDPLSVQAARENAAANGVSLDVRRIDLRDDEITPTPMVLANLLRGALLHYAQTLKRPPEKLIASGLLVEEADHVASAFAAYGLHERERRQGGEWVALCLTRGEH